MQPSSKAKTWGDGVLAVSNETGVSGATMMQVEEGESDDEFVEIKPKHDHSKQGAANVISNVNIDVDTDMKDMSKTVTQDGQVADVEAPQEERPLTDEEWLRSRTSRTLDLTDNVEEHLARLTTAAEKPSQADLVGHNTSVSAEISAEVDVPSVTVTEEEVENQTVESEESDPIIEEISKTRRLFLRNLPNTTIEEDLWQAFEPFGELEEVMLSLQPPYTLLKKTLHPPSSTSK